MDTAPGAPYIRSILSPSSLAAGLIPGRRCAGYGDEARQRRCANMGACRTTWTSHWSLTKPRATALSATSGEASICTRLRTGRASPNWGDHAAARWRESSCMPATSLRPTIARRSPAASDWPVLDRRRPAAGRRLPRHVRWPRGKRIACAAYAARIAPTQRSAGRCRRLAQPWLSDAQKRALSDPLRRLHAALDAGKHVVAIGAAKDLGEAACRVAIERTGQAAPRGESLPALFKQAAATLPLEVERDGVLGHSIAATVQRLAGVRNAAGAGHGHASLPHVSARHARLAAAAASGISDFLLGDERVSSAQRLA
jgi:abortive infection Abi-like protein